ncbi:MAG: tetratricopeptide repeat protein [Thermodesulfovibrionales bacterium]
MATALTAETRNKVAGSLLVVVVLVALVYSNVLPGPFVYDDRTTILVNETVQDLSASFAQYHSRRYVGYLSFALNYAVAGLRPYGYHVVNNAVHAATALVIFWLAYSVARSPRVRDSVRSPLFVALAAASLFAVHPVQTQTVTYISQRFTSLASLFYVAALAFYVKARCRKDDMAAGESVRMYPAVVLHGLSLLCALLAMKTKEIAFTLPAMVTFSETVFFQRSAGLSRRIMSVLPFWLLLLAGAAVEVYRGLSVHDGLGDALGELTRETALLSRADYLFTQSRVILTYIRLLLFPVNQNFDYDYPVFPVIGISTVLASSAVILALLALAAYATRRNKLVAYGLVWFFVALSVESSIVPIRDVINEHRLYLPSVGICIAAAGMLDRSTLKQREKTLLLGVLVLLFACVAYARNGVWRSPVDLWADTVAKSPFSARAHNNLGVAFKEELLYEKATPHFEKALLVQPGYAPAIFNLGDVQYELGNYGQAVELLNKARTSNRDAMLALDIENKLGRAYGAQGDFKKAIEVLSAALDQHPRSLVLLNNLGVQHLRQGDPDRAIAVFEKGLQIRKERFLYRNLAVAYAQKKQPDMSRAMLDKAEALRGQPSRAH